MLKPLGGEVVYVTASTSSQPSGAGGSDVDHAGAEMSPSTHPFVTDAALTSPSSATDAQTARSRGTIVTRAVATVRNNSPQFILLALLSLLIGAVLALQVGRPLGQATGQQMVQTVQRWLGDGRFGGIP